MVLSLGIALAVPSAAVNAADGPGPAASLAPALGNAASGGPVIVVLKSRDTALNLRTQGAQRKAAAYADQAPLVADVRAHSGTDIRQLVSVNAFAARLSAAEVRRLRGNASVAKIVPDAEVTSPQQPAPPGQQTAEVAKKAARSRSCPVGAQGPGTPVQEPEAVADIHASDGDPHAPGMANAIATGKGVIVATDDMDGIAGNPEFQRADGSHVVIDAPDYSADAGTTESYGDASSVAAQGRIVYDYAKALPYAGLPAGCPFVIKGAAPDASLVDSLQIDTPPFDSARDAATTRPPTVRASQIVAGIDRAVTVEHADVISESWGYFQVPGEYAFGYEANDAAIAAGVTVIVSAGDSGVSGTVSSPATDPLVIAAGAVDNFRLLATAYGYPGYVSDNIAAVSSGGTSPNNKVVDLVAPGNLGEIVCGNPAGGCPAGYKTGTLGGTSEAAPLIAAGAADVIEAYRDTHAGADPTPAVVKQILTGTARDIDAPADQQGAGLLDVYAAVKAAQRMPQATGTGGDGGTPALVASPSQLDLTGAGGSVDRQSVRLYNTGDTPTTVTGTYRSAGPEHPIGEAVTENVSAPDPALPVPADGARAAQPVSVNVPPGLDRLNADMIWPDPTNNNRLRIDLFDPKGRLVQMSYDFGIPASAQFPGTAPDIQHIGIAHPVPGRWTARIVWTSPRLVPSDPPDTPGTYRGPLSFRVSGQNWVTTPATGPVTIPARSSASATLRVALPTAPGDHPESVRFTARDGASTALPIARRTLIPSDGGRFRTLITGSVGRAVGQISTFDIDVPAGRSRLDVAFHTADDSPDNTFTYYLIDPDGNVMATDPVQEQSALAANGTGELTTAAPAAGRWEIDVVLDLTESGKEFTQTVYGVADDPR